MFPGGWEVAGGKKRRVIKGEKTGAKKGVVNVDFVLGCAFRGF